MFCGFSFFFATWHSIWDLSTPSRDCTYTLQWKRGVLTTGPPRKPLWRGVSKLIVALINAATEMMAEYYKQTGY